MDSGSSPRRPAAASLPTNKLLSESVVELAKARTRGSDYFDDTSSVLSGSVTSMASTNKAAVCLKCSEPEDLPSKPFVQCSMCRKIWHQCCLEEDCPKSSGLSWNCSKCRSQQEPSKVSDRKRRYRSSTLTLTSKGMTTKQPSERVLVHTTIAKDPLSSRAVTQNGSSKTKSGNMTCAEPNCTNPIFGSSSTVGSMCKKHEIEQKHAKAKAASYAPIPPLQRSPIKKAKLHPKGPDDRVHLKQKRTEIRSNFTSNAGDIRPRNFDKPANIVQHSAVNYSGTSYSLEHATLGQRTTDTRRISIGETQGLEKPRSSISETIVNVPTRKRNSLIAPAVQSPQTTKPLGEASKITQDLPPARPSSLLPEKASPENTPPSSTAVPDHTEDIDMPDACNIDCQPEAGILPTINGTSQAQLNIELEADQTSPETDPETALQALNEGWILGDRPPTCLELKLARGNYDENTLDFYLEQQRDRDDSEPPTRAVVESQQWGYIDPKVVWPEEPFTEDQAAAKREEIEARGGRKAAMGKLFTAQNLREKADNGWGIHQWGDKKNDDATKEVVKRLEDLFNVEDFANLVPGTRNGRLVMVERDASQEEELRGPGRRKKKNGPKVYPVYGAPNTV